MQLVIGISGFVGSGKTTVSEWFIGNHGFRRFSFADPIRQMVMVLGVDEATLRDPKKKEEPHPALMGRTPREVMETLGTAWGRDMVHPHLWIGQFGLRTKHTRLVIVDDVRFPNEATAIRALGGKVFKLIVPGQEPRVRTDFAVQRLVPDYALDNNFIDGGVTTKALYEFIYAATFGKVWEEPPGMKLDVWTGIPAQVRAEIMSARATAWETPEPPSIPTGEVAPTGFPTARETLERAQDAAPAAKGRLGR